VLVLSVEQVRAGYGGSLAVRDVTIDVGDRELVAIIGPNGAGKTTLMLTISGLVRATGGTMTYGDARIDRLRPHEIVELGICHVPQGRHLFPSMSVAENLEVGSVRARLSRRALAAKLDEVYALFPALHPRQDEKAGRLSGGQQQMVAIGRALMAGPRLLLLDEPSTGLAPLIVEELMETIVALRDRGLSILLVEQNAEMALTLVDRAFVMSAGTIRATGSAAQLKDSESVRSAYLGHATH
jgi:branched-chain amino acid transport system ATP-binding protein